VSNFTDKKISPKRSRDRRHYYAPTEKDVQCPFLKVDASGNPEIVQDATDPYEVRKVRRCACTEAAPFCSYHLGDGNDDTVIDPLTGVATTERTYFCHRYEVMHEDPNKPPVDSHNKKLGIVEGELTWK
jgi:hypothetical protein